MEIGETPDFNKLENLLKDDIKNQFISFLTKDSDLEDHQIEVINEHFKAYNYKKTIQQHIPTVR